MQQRTSKIIGARLHGAKSFVLPCLIVSLVALASNQANGFSTSYSSFTSIKSSARCLSSFGVNGQRCQSNKQKTKTQTSVLATTSSTFDDFTSMKTGDPGHFSLDSYTDLNDTRYSSADWLHNMKNLPRSSVLRAVKGPVLSIMSWSFFVSIVHRCLMMSKKWSGLAQHMNLSSTPHSLLVSSLGLLLVFRTNSAYQKFAVSSQCAFYMALISVLLDLNDTRENKYLLIFTHTECQNNSPIDHRKDVEYGKKSSRSQEMYPALRLCTRPTSNQSAEEESSVS
mmetsp:Transcript_5148/g.6844  ORF Transcript_5148/g.6844 Transcript_5148/m.6844 type:complete len:282 (-) Transcript_5148:1068-1913(-)